MVNSKKKGARGELMLVREFKKHGFTARRSQQYCGNVDAADIIVDELDHIIYPECKNTQVLNIHATIEKALEECGDKAPAIFWHKNHQPWLCIMRLDDWLPLMSQITKNNNEQKEICASTNQSGDT